MNAQTVYREEAFELLTELESALLELEEIPEDAGLIGRVFRALHTIKGSGAMFGFDEIASFAHEIENAFDLVRDGKINASKELINIALAARDQIRVMLDASDGGEKADQTRSREIIAQIWKLVSEGREARGEGSGAKGYGSEVKDAGQPLTPNSESQTPNSAPITYHIRFRPMSDIFHTGTNPILLLNELRELGECRIRAMTHAIPMLGDMDPEFCYVSWDIMMETSQPINMIRDVFIFVEDKSELRIEEPGNESDEVGTTLRISSSGEHEKQKADKPRKSDPASSIRVPAAKLDNLVNLVGELVTVQARLSRKAGIDKDPELISVSEEVERLTTALRDNTMNIRMLPISTIFGNLRRLVRDLSAELGKEVFFETEGDDTELDKTLIEKLNDPIVHIIRNAIDHGIEKPGVRQSLGKPPEGIVHLSAFHSGANVLIRISDDGAGLDSVSIRAKAIERGLISADEKLSENDIHSLIFLPGLSTSDRLTEVSGRGVGMDVVRRAVESLRGIADVGSEKGKGTTITLRLPLTLAIVDGLLIRVAESSYVLPLSVVEECVESGGKDLTMIRSRQIMNFRGHVIPYLSLRNLFMTEGIAPAIEQIVIAEAKDTKVGLGVDRVEGQHQTVIKNMSKAYRNAEYISGATILGDGTVALILDVLKLTQMAQESNRESHIGDSGHGR